MMYEYMTLEDNITIAHSDLKSDGTVKVYIEKPVDGGFQHITCYLPEYKWCDNEGFSNEELIYLRKIIKPNAYLIIESSRQEG